MKRRMPAHIVLPNGMWRFVKRGTKAAAKSKRSRKRGGIKVARRTRHRRSGGGMMNKLLSKKNLMYTAGAVLLGAAVLKVEPKIAGAVGGFMGAGPVGAIAGYLAAPTISRIGGGILGNVGGTTSSTYVIGQ